MALSSTYVRSLSLRVHFRNPSLRRPLRCVFRDNQWFGRAVPLHPQTGGPKIPETRKASKPMSLFDTQEGETWSGGGGNCCRETSNSVCTWLPLFSPFTFLTRKAGLLGSCDPCCIHRSTQN